MKPRAALALTLAAGYPAAASAQDQFIVHYSWHEVFAGTTTPATGPLGGNSIVDSGEGARFRVGVTALLNGTNAVGQTTTYTNPAPGGVGTVRGLAHAVYDFLGDGNQPSAQGSWFRLLWGGAPWGIPQVPPTPMPGGAGIPISGLQFISPGGTANHVNSNQSIFFGTWTPDSYAPRTVNWTCTPSTFVPAGTHNAVLVSYGLGTGIDPTNGQPFVYDLLAPKYIGTDFGQGLNIPIAPAPSTLALLGLTALMIRSPRRPHS